MTCPNCGMETGEYAHGVEHCIGHLKANFEGMKRRAEAAEYLGRESKRIMGIAHDVHCDDVLKLQKEVADMRKVISEMTARWNTLESNPPASMIAGKIDVYRLVSHNEALQEEIRRFRAKETISIEYKLPLPDRESLIAKGLKELGWKTPKDVEALQKESEELKSQVEHQRATIIQLTDCNSALGERTRKAEAVAMNQQAQILELTRQRDGALKTIGRYQSPIEIAREIFNPAEWRDTIERANLMQQRDNWEKSAADFCRNMEFYRDIVHQVGNTFGIAAKISDDGSVQDDVLALRVPELVIDLHRRLAAARTRTGTESPTGGLKTPAEPASAPQ